ncbi:hypothetical protein DFS34DRAFT_366727 [Phlyctochytrium arcticum]|nr:hypothetical protein DFS34DRAFT_366727 [Phlyctochytrium arcticum]
MNSTKTNITENLTCSNGITRVGNDIRGSYSAGNNISISRSTISCTYDPEPEQPYVGGNGITVAGKTISNTISLVAGTGVIVVEDAPNEETTEGSESKVLKSGGGDIIQVTGGLTGVLSGLGSILGGAGAAIGTASSAIGAIGASGGLLGGLAATGGFISIFGRERERKQDINGDPILD